jgi:poly(hydroxyalkanoate) depolymerase family esterase
MRRAWTLALLLLSVGVLQGASVAADNGSFTRSSYKSSKGVLSYKTYTPPRAGRRPVNLVVVLHGGGEPVDDAATRSRMNTVAQRLRFVVVYPEQNLAYDSGRKWDWATASKQGRSNREASLIAGITRTVTARHHLDRRRVFVMGMSAGAGMAGAMVASYPELYSGLGIEAGCPFDYAGCAGGSVTPDQSAAAALKAMGRLAKPVPVFNEYGSADPIAAGVRSDQVVPSWLTIDDTLDNGRDDGSISRSPATNQTITPALPAKPYTATGFRDHRGCALALNWIVYGESHAWSGGAQTSAQDPSSDPLAPDATTAMYQFWTHPNTLGASRKCLAVQRGA